MFDGNFADYRLLINGLVDRPVELSLAQLRALPRHEQITSVGCPLRAHCTNATGGRTIAISPHEQALTRARQRQADPDWQADYRTTRPKVERKLAHLMRRKHGGRHARVRGTANVDADFRLLAAAANLARLAVLGLRSTPTCGWATT